MIDLYYWPTPNGWKITIFLEEASLPYRVVAVNIGAGEQFEPGFLKISPNNRMPAIVDPEGPDGKPISIFESGAILIYLAEKTGQFLPSDPHGRYEVLQWLMFQMGGVGPMFGQASHFLRYAPEKIPLRDRPLHQRGAPALRGPRRPARRSTVRRRRLFDRRHGDLPLGTRPGDLMTSIDGVDFDRARANRLEGRFGESSVGFLGRDEMLVNKRAAGRPKDLADIALLEEGEL